MFPGTSKCEKLVNMTLLSLLHEAKSDDGQHFLKFQEDAEMRNVNGKLSLVFIICGH